MAAGKVYLYPKVFQSENPYINDLENALSENFKIINKESNRNGVLDLFKYLPRSDIYYFNWIESLPSRRFGKVQIIVFIFFLMLAKSLRKKLIWTLHNKYAHDKVRNRWVDFMFRTMIKYSDLILTHSQAGIDFIKEEYPVYIKKIKYFVHPIKPLFRMTSDKSSLYDFFIWGTIWPYKGVIEFLKFLRESGNTRLFKILIAGRCINEQVKTGLGIYLSENIIHRDEFFEMDEIANFANQSKFTLFTYKTESVLSSGSLMDSIRMGSVIIGPNVGAFKDLKSYSFMQTYDSYEGIIDIFHNFNYDKDIITNEIKGFFNENSWDAFGAKLNNAITSNLTFNNEM